MVSFPYLYMKTPIQLEFIDEEDCSFEVQTYIDISVYKEDEKFNVVFVKNIKFDDGYEESFLLKYCKGLKDLDEVDDVCREVIKEDGE